MIALGASLLWLLIVVVTLLRLFARWQNYPRLVPSSPQAGNDAAVVAVIIPARNEAHQISDSLRGLINQNYSPHRLKMVIVDDNSTDGTDQIVGQLVRVDDSAQLILSDDVPAGWSGKAYACWKGAQQAHDATWLCFLDADTILNTALISMAVRYASDTKLDLLSIDAFPVFNDFVDRQLLPIVVQMVESQKNPRKINNPSSTTAGASGQFLLVRSNAYFALNGHEAVKDKLAESTELARLFKSSGRAIRLVQGHEVLRSRVDINDIPRQIATAYQSASRCAFMVFVSFFMALASLGLPIWTLILMEFYPDPHHDQAFWISLCGTVLLMFTHIGVAIKMKVSPFYGILYQLGYMAGAVFGMKAMMDLAKGRTHWKLRPHPPADASPTSAKDSKTSHPSHTEPEMSQGD